MFQNEEEDVEEEEEETFVDRNFHHSNRHHRVWVTHTHIYIQGGRHCIIKNKYLLDVVVVVCVCVTWL